MSNDETFSFKEALNELHLQEEELKRLVSEGEIRAFRDGDNMRLRREDVETLRSELDGEIVFDDEDFSDAGMATEEITEADTLLDEIDDISEEPIVEASPAEETKEEEEAEEVEVIAKAAPIEEPSESMGIRVLMMATSLVLFLALPIFMSIGTGQISGLARSIAGVFFPDLKTQ